jgi:photosystem II stability/assembly factor-like uncharacterized protein
VSPPRPCAARLAVALIPLLLPPAAARAARPLAAPPAPVVVARLTARLRPLPRPPAPAPPLWTVAMASPQVGWAVVGSAPSRRVAKSLDGGRTWRVRVRAALPVLALAAPDPHHVDLLEGCPEGTCRGAALYASADGGATWRLRWRSRSLDAYALSFPTPSAGYAVVGPPPGAPRGAFRLLATRDGGRTWDARPLPTCAGGGGGGWAVAFDPAGRGFLLCGGPPSAGEQEKALWASGDGGRTWHLVAESVPPGGRPRPGALPVAGYVHAVFFLNARVGWIGLARAGLYRTDDGGRTFAPAAPPFPPAAADGGESVALLPSGFGWLDVAGTGALFTTHDGGRQWEWVYPPPAPLLLSALPGGAAAGAATAYDPQAVFLSEDPATGWTWTGEAPGAISAFQALAPDEFAAATDLGLGLAMSEDGGAAWTPLPPPAGWRVLALGLDGPAAGWLLARPGADPGAPAALFARDPVRGGPVWQRLATPFLPLAAAATGPRSGFALGRRGREAAMWATDDGGRTWTALRPPEVARATGLGAKGRLVWVYGPGFVDVSAWGGAAWTEIRLPPSLKPAALSFGDPDHALLAQADGAVWRTADGGALWTQVAAPPRP